MALACSVRAEDAGVAGSRRMLDVYLYDIALQAFMVE